MEGWRRQEGRERNETKCRGICIYKFISGIFLAHEFELSLNCTCAVLKSPIELIDRWGHVQYIGLYVRARSMRLTT